MCVYGVYLLCINKYTHMHVYILKNEHAYMYIHIIYIIYKYI